MNDLAKHASTSHRLVAGVALPAVSQWLRDALAHVAEPHPDIGIEPGRIRAGVREEAQRLLAAMDSTMRIATADEWSRFLRELAALPNGPSREAFAAKASAIAFALHDVPAAVLTLERKREALRTLRFWPTPADLDRILQPAITALQRERRLLKTVAQAPRAGVRDAPTDDERARIAAGMANLVAELSARSHATVARDPRPSTKALPLSDGLLLARYEQLAAAGGPGADTAAMRADALRAKLQGQRFDE